MNNATTYTRRDVTSIYEYLKEQAGELSNGRWTDFSSGDIGSILLGLMAFLADQNNFQLDKTASELFLDTAIERSSLIAMLKLVGYEPRHYMSARTSIEITTLDPSTTSTLIPAYTTFTNNDGTITYQNLVPIIISGGKGTCDEVYEGTRVQATYQYADITADGRIYLPDYKVGVNTVQVYIPSVSSDLIPRVNNVKFSDGDFVFSVHVSEDSLVYIQLPSYWTDVLTVASTIRVSYLLSSGEAGRIGAGILTKVANSTLGFQFTVTNHRQSVGGFFPETVDEIKVSAPVHARTMDTIVTKKDLNELAMATDETALIAQVKAGDYNDEWTGYVQPADAYKCKVLAVPFNRNETSIWAQDMDLNYKYTGLINGYNEFSPYWYNLVTDHGVTATIFNDHLVLNGTATANFDITFTIPDDTFTNADRYIYAFSNISSPMTLTFNNTGSAGTSTTTMSVTNSVSNATANLFHCTDGTLSITNGTTFEDFRLYIDVRKNLPDSYEYEPFTNGEKEEATYWYDPTNDILYDANYEVALVSIDTLTQQYSDSTKELIEYIDERRLASLMFTYEDPGRVVPNIQLNIYADPTDIRTQTIASQVKQFMQENYYRDKLAIGESLPGSVIGKDLLNRFDVINYIEVVEPDINITCKEDEYIDMYYAKFNIYVNDEPSDIMEWETTEP